MFTCEKKLEEEETNLSGISHKIMILFFQLKKNLILCL